MSSLDRAFNDALPYQLLSRVKHAYQNESLQPLLGDVASYVLELKSEITTLKRKVEAQDATEGGPAAKKRKLPVGTPADPSPSRDIWFAGKANFTATDISFSIPVRKKLAVEIMDGKDATSGGIRMPAPSSSEQAIAISWDDIEQVICVPVPEKAQPAYQFILIPCPDPSTSLNSEPLMWTVTSTHPKENQVIMRDLQSGAESYSANPDFTLDLLILQTINTNLKRFQKSITLPSPNEFSSALVQPHLKGQKDKAYHVKAWRGSKDGFLYFLSTGILFTPRKPLYFFPFSAITSISYSSVLQRTFNLNISARVSPAGIIASHAAEEIQETEFEFAMLDQADFAGIDAYIKRHELHDASLAESRRAKIYNVNAGRSATRANGDDSSMDVNGVPAAGALHANAESGSREDGFEEETELARTERELQDAEDAEEEDYDPSGGESEGSGSESEEEEDPGQDGEIEEVEPVDEDEEAE